MPIKVLLTDDHTVLLDGLHSALRSEGSIEIIGKAANGEEAHRLAKELRPDVLLIDIDMPGMSGIEAVGVIRKSIPDIKAILLTMHLKSAFVLEAVEAGINGYLLKTTGVDELIDAIKTVMNDESYFCKEASDLLMKSLTGKKEGEDEVQLTPREKEIIQLIAEGLTYKNIAAQLYISQFTVINHRQNIIQKLGLKSNAELIRFAVRKNLV